LNFLFNLAVNLSFAALLTCFGEKRIQMKDPFSKRGMGFEKDGNNGEIDLSFSRQSKQKEKIEGEDIYPNFSDLEAYSILEKEDFESAGKHTDTMDLLTGHRKHQVPRPRRIFVNRSLRLDRISWIGFDMDYTLLRYHAKPMEELCYKKAIEKLIELGYSEELDSFIYHPQRAMRGLLIDKEKGNLLQINRHRHVGAAYHGYQALNKEERKQAYRLDPMKFSAMRKLEFQPSDGGYRKFRMIDSLFGVPEACLFSDLIEWSEKQENKVPLDYLKIYNDVRLAMDNAHADGLIREAVLSDINRYVVFDPEVAILLERLRASGKKLFLLTNSDWDYTKQNMTFLLEHRVKNHEKWSDFFDLVVVKAKKPSFFKKMFLLKFSAKKEK